MSDELQVIPGTARFGRRLRVGAFSLMGLVACGGVLVLIGRFVWENRDPDHVIVRESIGELRSVDAERRSAAAQELGRLGTRAADVAVPALVAALADPEADVRAAAAEALGQVAQEPAEARAAAGPLAEALKDPQPAVRVAAADAIGVLVGIRRAGARPPLDAGAVLTRLAERLGDPEAGVRSAVLRAIALAGPGAEVAPPEALVAMLDSPSEDDRAAAAVAVARFRHGLDPIIPTLLRIPERLAPRARPAYIRAFDEIAPPALASASLPTLMDALDDDDRAVRCRAIRLLAKLGPGSRVAIPALIGIVRESIGSGPADDSPTADDPAGEAARALGRLAPGTPRAVEAIAALTDALRRGHPTRRGPAAYALEDFARDAVPAIPALAEGLRKTLPSDARVMDGGVTIARVLGEIAPGTDRADEAIAALIEALDARSPYTRIEAIKALTRFGPAAARAQPRLRAMENDPNRAVGAAASAAVRDLQTPPSPDDAQSAPVGSSIQRP